MLCTVEVLLGACVISGARLLALAAGEGTRLKVAALVLIFCAAQIDAYFAVAWNSAGTTDLASTLVLRQVF